jgi:hypothetical protein
MPAKESFRAKAKTTPLSEVMIHEVYTVTPNQNGRLHGNILRISSFVIFRRRKQEIIGMISIGDVVSTIMEAKDRIQFLNNIFQAPRLASDPCILAPIHIDHLMATAIILAFIIGYGLIALNIR